jgi:hypothetical protein
MAALKLGRPHLPAFHHPRVAKNLAPSPHAADRQRPARLDVVAAELAHAQIVFQFPDALERVLQMSNASCRPMIREAVRQPAPNDFQTSTS